MKQKSKTILALTGLAAGVMHILNRIESSRIMSNSIPCNYQNNYYEWRFGKIRYLKKGTGTPLLLIHNLTAGSSSYEYHKIIDKLSQNQEVYCIDLLGYGLSDKPNITYTNYLYVQLVSDFIKNIIKRKTNIAACGDSAPIAFMVCHNDAELVENMITINPPSLYTLNQIPSKQTKLLKFLLDFPILGTFIYNLYTNKDTFTAAFQKKYFFNSTKIEEEDIIAYMESAHTPDYHSKYAYSSYIGRYTNINIIHALKEINHNIFLIVGDTKEMNDNIIDNYKYYNTAIESTFIKNTRLLPHLECPEDIIALFETYLHP